MLNTFFPIAAQAVREPREAASTLMSMGVPTAALWPAFGALVCLSVILSFLSGGLEPAAGQASVGPLVLAVTSAVAGAASVFLVWKVGAAMDGTGRFEEALLLTVFLQGLIFAGQLVEFVLYLVVPALSGVFSIAIILLTFWINLNFIAALHGFSSLWRSFGVLLFASLGVALILIFLMSLLGVQFMAGGIA
ncbi:hypothetical protein [Boseongicola aestuarii]|uniref:Yip1 domain protein n=1 Tax=Boseongicola aestuarii TaxID=1470561 RepID=A0A238J2C9_9RHOB|nr:hypothetical protein [Boseongicola aestuarii]SMX24483.1 hypothetical protein BOA8489_02608 [Boseongicola aestuarii]